MPLDPRQVEALLHAALDLSDPAARAAFLDRECAADVELRCRVDELLREAEPPSLRPEGLLAVDAPEADFVLGSAPVGSPDATIGLSDHGGTLDASSVDPDGGTVGFSDLEAPRPAPQPVEAIVGTLVAGRYKVRQAIGEGGMGTVYLAEQVQPVKRMVALKLVRAGMDSRQVLARFESERQALAIMDHPHIARVLDAGSTATGHPFFVMELVRGIPLTDYCDRHRLDLPTRLNLFRQICSAVQHAHQKGVIHRDLKPTNILVEEHNGTAVPKVIDFGLAKATTGLSLTEASVYTALNTIAGTPLYMAPEQATFNALDVDTRVDIYALGVILYELLTGSTPIRKESLHQAALDEVLRVIREDEPPTPSRRISTSEALPSVAANRHVEPIRLGRFVRGDLDWIVMKALAKERNRRYDSAIGLANDVERFLNDEPVTAGPPTARYRTAKFIRRHRRQVVAASLVVLALVGGTVGTTVGLVEARRQATRAIERAEGERRAKLDAQEKKALAEANERKAVAAVEGERQARETAEAVLGFVEDKVFAAARPRGQDGGLGYDVKLADAIAAALPVIETGFDGKPLVEARLRRTIGQSFLYLGKPDLAVGQFAAARSLTTQYLGADHPDTLASMYGQADSDTALGRYAEALQLFEETLILRRARLGPDDLKTLASASKLATSYYLNGRHLEALKLFEETIARQQVVLGPDNPRTLRSMTNLALTYRALGRNAEALKLREEVLARQKAKLGLDNPSTLYSMIHLAESYNLDGRDAEALGLAEESVARQKAKLGLDHPDTLWNTVYLAYCYGRHGRHAEALQMYEETLAIQKVKLGLDHPDSLNSMSYLIGGYSNLGRHAEALQLADETLALMKAKLGPDHSETLNVLNNKADALIAAGRTPEALPLLDQYAIAHPWNLEASLKIAALWGWFGREAEFVATRRRALAVARNTSDVVQAERAAKLSSLLPSSDRTDRDAALTLARMAAEPGDEAPNRLDRLLALGMAAYRSGDDSACDEPLREAEAVGKSRPMISGTAAFYRSMSLQRRGLLVEARRHATEAAASMTPLPSDEKNPLAGIKITHDNLIVWLACKEAQALIRFDLPPVAPAPAPQ